MDTQKIVDENIIANITELAIERANHKVCEAEKIADIYDYVRSYISVALKEALTEYHNQMNKT